MKNLVSQFPESIFFIQISRVSSTKIEFQTAKNITIFIFLQNGRIPSQQSKDNSWNCHVMLLHQNLVTKSNWSYGSKMVQTNQSTRMSIF